MFIVLQEQDGKKFLETTLPTGLETLEGVIAGNEGGNGYFVGNKVRDIPWPIGGIRFYLFYTV